MKKMFALVIAFGLSLSACMPAAFQSQAASPTPIPESVLQATAALLAQQTIQALPSNTSAPSNTPVVLPPSATPTQATPTETPNPVLLTLTATLGTGTVTPGTEIANSSLTTTAGTSLGTNTPVNTPNPLTPTIPPQPQFFGTLPPSLPYGSVILINKAEADVYVSLRCTTKSGYVTILEYPVKNSIEAEAPLGSYTYVAWVGGRQFTGAFYLSGDKVIRLEFFKNRVTIN